ncbi:nuclear transport factor 2 family protein [Mycobacterium branderi]
MTVFASAWATKDAARVASYFSDNAVYHNIPMDPVEGRDPIAATVSGFMAMGGQVSSSRRATAAPALAESASARGVSTGSC